MIIATGNTADFLLSEAPGQRSRALWNLEGGQGYLRPGTFLAMDGTVATASAEVAGLLYGAVDTGTGSNLPAVKATVIDRDAEVHGEMLQWDESDTDAIKTSFSQALEDVGIRVRWTQRPVGLEFDQVDEAPPAGGEGNTGGGGG